MTVTAPETSARDALILLLSTEFGPDQFPVKSDKLHGSLGSDGTVIGVYPERMVSNPSQRLEAQYPLVVQFYGKYTLKVDPKQTVDPRWIEERAERFRRALRTITDPRTGEVWYFNLERVEYPDDPTGNKSRFEAYLTARGNNTALIETTG